MTPSEFSASASVALAAAERAANRAIDCGVPRRKVETLFNMAQEVCARWERRGFDPSTVSVPLDALASCVSSLDALVAECSDVLDAAKRRREVELASMPYGDFLLTPEWRSMRLRAIRSADFACQVCNGSGALDVHHRTYERRGRELPGDLVVLCWECHRLFHKGGRLRDPGAG